MSLRCSWPLSLCSERAAVAPGITSPVKAGRSWDPGPSLLSEEHQLSQKFLWTSSHIPLPIPGHRLPPGCRGGWNRENPDGSPPWEVTREQWGLPTGEWTGVSTVAPRDQWDLRSLLLMGLLSL